MSLLLLGAGITIGYDLGGKRVISTPAQEETEKVNQENQSEQNQAQVQKLIKTVNSLQDSVKVLKAQIATPQIQMPEPKPTPPGFKIIEPTVVLSGKSRSLLGGKVLLSVSPHASDESSEVEVIIRRTKSPLETAMEYGEVLRLFYAHTGRVESFEFNGETYFIECVEVAKFDGTMGLKFALYLK